MRQTEARKQIISLLSASPSPISASELLSHLTVNKTTVYRQLESLIKQGVIHEVRFSDRCLRYEPSNRHHHHHLVCTECHSVADIVIPDNIENQVKSVSLDTGFKIIAHNLEFFGICVNCQPQHYVTS